MPSAAGAGTWRRPPRSSSDSPTSGRVPGEGQRLSFQMVPTCPYLSLPWPGPRRQGYLHLPGAAGLTLAWGGLLAWNSLILDAPSYGGGARKLPPSLWSISPLKQWSCAQVLPAAANMPTPVGRMILLNSCSMPGIQSSGLHQGGRILPMGRGGGGRGCRDKHCQGVSAHCGEAP